MTFSLNSAFASPSSCFSNELRTYFNELELCQDNNRLVHMQAGRRQLESFMQKQYKQVATVEQLIKKETLQWEDHVAKAWKDKDVKVQKRSVLPTLLPGLKNILDIKVGRQGIPDDAVYLNSSFARQWLPRGNCIAEWQIHDRTYFFPLIRGYRKFTGQEDDGELKKQSKSDGLEIAKFFTKSQKYSKCVISTSKENGDAGHLAVLKRNDGEYIYVLGSKSTHLLAQTLDDIGRAREYHKKVTASDPYSAAEPIAMAILRMLFALGPAQRILLCEFLWQTRATASFEVLCPSHQHVQLLDYLNEDTPYFYGLSLMTLDFLEGTEICVNPVLLYEFMRKLGVRTVSYEIYEYNANAFKTALAVSKNNYQHEGVVHLFLDEDAAVIGMQKHKTIWYVCLRAIREKAKTFCRTLTAFKPPKGRAKPTTPQEALKTTKISMNKRFQAIKIYVGISDEHANAYKILGEQFIDYLFKHELCCGIVVNKDEEEKCKQVTRDVADLFPVILRRFLDYTGLSDEFGNTHNVLC